MAILYQCQVRKYECNALTIISDKQMDWQTLTDDSITCEGIKVCKEQVVLIIMNFYS